MLKKAMVINALVSLLISLPVFLLGVIETLVAGRWYIAVATYLVGSNIVYALWFLKRR